MGWIDLLSDVRQLLDPLLPSLIVNHPTEARIVVPAFLAMMASGLVAGARKVLWPGAYRGLVLLTFVLVWAAGVFGWSYLERTLITEESRFLAGGGDRRVVPLRMADKNPILIGECPRGHPDLETNDDCLSVRLLRIEEGVPGLAFFHFFGRSGPIVVPELDECSEHPYLEMELKLVNGCETFIHSGHRLMRLLVVDENGPISIGVALDTKTDKYQPNMLVGVSRCPNDKDTSPTHVIATPSGLCTPSDPPQ